jgi:hypothetical protein
MTRYEAAALLNACLDRITETTDELKRLMKEFQKELAVLRGRFDGLEAKVGELEAHQFSTTTKLSGQATFVVGANAFSGSAVDTAANTVHRAPNDFTGRPRTPVPLPNGTTFNGKDLLRTNLRPGNFGRSVFGGEPHSLALSTLDVAFEEDAGPMLLASARPRSFASRTAGLGRTEALVWRSASAATPLAIRRS